jgi:hypothetical protein
MKGKILKEHLEKPIDQASLLWIARSIHRTHKNQRLDIKDKTPLWYLYNDNSENIVIKKAVQLGVSEYLIARAIHESKKGLNCLYILPTFSMKGNFVQDRIDKTIMFTPYYTELLNMNDKKLAESTSLKQFQTGSIIFAGSGTPVSFISFPADVLIIDEQDQCDQDNLIMAEERLAASQKKTILRVSNPTYLNMGIDKEYNKSDRKVWKIKHDCGKWIELDFFTHVVKEIEHPQLGKNYVLIDKEYSNDRDIYPICEYCNKPINRHSEGEYESQLESDISGYQMSSLFASSISIKKMVEVFKEGLVNDLQMQRFYNAYLGKAYTSSGAKITEGMLDSCIDADYTLPDRSESICLAGIDIGKVFNIIIAEMLSDRRLKIVHICELPVNDLREVLELFMRYHVKMFVADARPETRIVRMLMAKAKELGCYGFMSQFTTSKKEISWDTNNLIISSGRTYTLDTLKEQILTKQIILPKNAKSIQSFYSQMMASTRIYNEKRQDYEWVESEPDHYMFAMAYLILARSTLIQIKT